MEDDNSASSKRQPSAVSSLKACEECRTRKIRCDRNRPCAHCRAANLICRNNTQPTEARARVTISKQYENKIDRIENRLANIERLLRNGASASSSPADAHHTPSSLDSQGISIKAKREIASAEYLDDESAAATPFAGHTSMQAESLAAKDALEQTVGSSPSITQDRHLNEALSSLRSIVGRLKGDNTGPAPAPSPAATTLEEARVPTWEQMSALLERAKPRPPAIFAMCLPCTPFDEFVQKVEEFYRQQGEVSLAQKLVVFCGCVCLSGEYASVESNEKAEYYDSITRGLQRATLKVIGELPLALASTWENLEGIVSASTICIDMCKPSLSWTLTSVAARITQVLGYHRASTLAQDSPIERNKKLVMFWMTYIMDRNTSLRVGRTPCIQDYDIDVPRPQPYRTMDVSLLYLLNFWVDLSRVQGRICWLYSPGALTQTLEERSQTVDELAAELNQAFKQRLQVNYEILPMFIQPDGKTDGKTITAEPMLEGDKIAHYTALTLVLQAAPNAGPGQSPALDAARECLRISRNLRRDYASNAYMWASYCHWVILHNPLTPFTVVFSNVIANHEGATEDLQLLRDYCDSLEPARRISDGVEKFYQLCSVFYKVANAYVHAKQHERKRRTSASKSQIGQNQQWSQPLTGEFDEYISQLGFAPQQNIPPVNSDMSQMDTEMSAYLQQDWYTGNVSLYGLVEQDINSMAAGWNFDMPTDTWTGDGSYRN